jgi:hypothetical protein
MCPKKSGRYGLQLKMFNKVGSCNRNTEHLRRPSAHSGLVPSQLARRFAFHYFTKKNRRVTSCWQ